MKKLSLLKYFTFYSLIAFLFTGISLTLFINNHMVNDKIDSMEQITNIALDYIVEPELSTTDYNGNGYPLWFQC